MDEQTENQILLRIGELGGKLDSMEKKQTEMCKEIGGLRKEISGVKVKSASFGTLLGGAAGFLTQYLK